MTAAERLVAIVEEVRDESLEAMEKAYAGRPDSYLDSPNKWMGSHSTQETRRSLLERFRSERAEWQAARDLLTELLELKRRLDTRESPETQTPR